MKSVIHSSLFFLIYLIFNPNASYCVRMESRFTRSLVRAVSSSGVWIIRDGVQEQFNDIPAAETLPAVRYILPYPNQVIQRSQGVYKNYYGY